jgi:hypothetical protein
VGCAGVVVCACVCVAGSPCMVHQWLAITKRIPLMSNLDSDVADGVCNSSYRAIKRQALLSNHRNEVELLSQHWELCRKPTTRISSA